MNNLACVSLSCTPDSVYEDIKEPYMTTFFKALGAFFKRVKVVKLNNLMPYQQLVDFFSSYELNIRNFTCENERSVVSNTNKLPEGYLTGLTGFKSLRLFYFDIQPVLNYSNVESYFITFEYLNEEENYY